MSEQFPCVVVGAGPAGIATALALGHAGCDVTLAAPRPPPGAADTRTAALFAGSINLLKNLGAWQHIAPASAPISAIRIVDDTGALLRAPEVVFTAAEVGLDTFGWNVPNRALVTGLLAAVDRAQSRVRRHETTGIAGVEIEDDRVVLVSNEGVTLEAKLVAGADGRNSICRAAAGIGTRTWSYDQAAIACSFRHARAHNDISTEFHRPCGPFTTVPLPGRASSLVWVDRPAEAQRLMSFDDDAFQAAIESRLQGLLGTVSDVGPRTVFPLSGLTADTFASNRVALIGEAAHVIPPIGAQGLNLGLRDAATLADCVADATSRGCDPGATDVLAAYSRRRHPDIGARVTTVDVLNRSLLSTMLPIRLARGLGLIALKSFGPLRRAAIREGLQWNRDVPSLLKSGNPDLLAGPDLHVPPTSAA